MPTLRAAALAILLPLAASACCAGEEERSVGINSDPTLTLTRGPGGPETVVTLSSGVGQTEVPPSDFAAVYRAAQGADAGVDAVAVTLAGDDTATGEMVTLVLALPLPLRSGDHIPVGEAVPVPMSLDVRSRWGVVTLAEPDRAGVGLWTGTYTFPPPEFHPAFQATSATGDIEVLRTGDDFVTMRLDVTAAGAGGATIRVRGDVTLHASRYTPPC